jgi:hypothetical protein
MVFGMTQSIRSGRISLKGPGISPKEAGDFSKAAGQKVEKK